MARLRAAAQQAGRAETGRDHRPSARLRHGVAADRKITAHGPVQIGGGVDRRQARSVEEHLDGGAIVGRTENLRTEHRTRAQVVIDADARNEVGKVGRISAHFVENVDARGVRADVAR